MLLLALFVKPLFARGSDGLFFIRFRHRRTVVRNTACTVGVVLLQLAETVVVYTVVYHKGSVEQVRTHHSCMKTNFTHFERNDHFSMTSCFEGAGRGMDGVCPTG